MISKTLVYAGILAVGFTLGYNAQNLIIFSDGASKVNSHHVHDEEQFMCV
jgi:hypothetical protein